MDKKHISQKLKKYLFFISIVFLVLSSTHLIYNYIYDDSKKIAQKWWSITETFVWKIPNFNPLLWWNSSNNNYINNILYRSLLTYDINKNKIIWDLAQCDIRNLSKIKCFLNDNINWSNWNKITIEDVIATYNIIKETNVNPVLKNKLVNIKITSTDSSIIFESKFTDINILTIFFQWIMPKNIIDEINIEKIKWNLSIKNWELSPENGIYSWKYKVSKVNKDEITGTTKVFLEKNIFYSNNPTYIDTIILKYYKDHITLLKDKSNINIYNDNNNLIGESIPRLENNKYILNQYVAAFLNKDKIEYPNLRNIILSTINQEKVLESVWKTNNKLIKSPFLNELDIKTLEIKNNLKYLLNTLWYHKKDFYLLDIWTQSLEIKPKNNEKYSSEGKIEINNNTSTSSWILVSTWSISENEINNILEKDSKTINLTKIKNSITLENYNSDSKLIIAPEWIDRYNFIRKTPLTLEWKSNKNISEVYINDYKLKNYNPIHEKFYYKISTTIWNINKWENIYNIYFVENWKKSLKETITIFYDSDKKTLEKKELDLISKLINIKINNANKKILELEKEKKVLKDKIEKKDIQNNKKIKNENNVLTLTSEEIKKQNLINALDNRFYYNKNFKPYSLNLLYIEWSNEISKASIEIKEQLENSWIKINISSIKQSDLQKEIITWNEKYHILIAWISLWYFNFDLSRYFYSSQIDEWKNLSKIRNNKLDENLEKLKSELFIKEQDIIQKEVLNILEKEAIFKPLYSPYYSNLVIKNIEWYELPEIIPYNFYRFNPLVKSYTLKERIINKDSKWIIQFFSYLFKNLF